MVELGETCLVAPDGTWNTDGGNTEFSLDHVLRADLYGTPGPDGAHGERRQGMTRHSGSRNFQTGSGKEEEKRQ